VVFGGDQRTRSSKRNMRFELGLRRKSLITKVCAISQDGHYK
jgi:hypothetical protein